MAWRAAGWAGMVVMARRRARRVMVKEMRSGSRPPVWAASARAAVTSWVAQSRAQISWAIPAGWHERRAFVVPGARVLISR